MLTIVKSATKRFVDVSLQSTLTIGRKESSGCCWLQMLSPCSYFGKGNLRCSSFGGGTRGFLHSLNHDLFACQLQRAELLRKGSHEGPLFRMFPLSLQSIISNQMRPQRLRGVWFSRLLQLPSRRRSGSILSPGTHTGSI